MDGTTAFGIAAFTAIMALIGSIIIAVVSVSNHAYSERQKEKIEKRNKKAEKLEELVSALHDHFYWLRSGEEIKYNDPHPWSKIEAIQYVYFSEFADLSRALWDAEIHYVASRRANAISGQEVDGLTRQHWEKYAASFNIYMNEIEEYAKREFQ
jgi:hypothetical protein